MKYFSQGTSKMPLKLKQEIISSRWFCLNFILFVKLNRPCERFSLIALRRGTVRLMRDNWYRQAISRGPYVSLSRPNVATPCSQSRGATPAQPHRRILIWAPKFSGHRQAYKIRIIFSFPGLPASATSSLIKTNSCLTQSYPAICEVLQAELRPQIILTPFNKAVMLIRSCQI